MNAVVQQILSEQTDFILPKLREHHDNIAKKARAWIENKDKLLPVLQAFKILGADVSVQPTCHIHIGIAGDKDCFVKCWKLWRSLEVRLAAVEPGATEVCQFIYPHTVECLFHFTSTVCKRIKVGTKLVEQPIYETQCGADLSTVDLKELESPSHAVVPVEDNIPF